MCEDITAIKGLLKDGANHKALTTDIWTSHVSQASATTTTQYTSKYWQLKSCVLETLFFPGSHIALNIAQKLKHVTAQYSVGIMW